MDAEINNVIYVELNSGPKIANSTCGKTIIAGTIDRDSTVLSNCKIHEYWQKLKSINKILSISSTFFA